MRTRQLGNTDLHLSTIGFGAWAIGGGGWKFGWGPQDDQDSIKAIHTALDLGVNWIDTAAIYGLGHSEEIVAEALAGRRNQVIIATKCSLLWDKKKKIFGGLKAESIKEECESSLRRLKTDTIDLYQIHWPDPEEDIEEGWKALNDLIQEGKVRYGGVSNFSTAQMDRARKIAPISSLQPPYHLLDRKVEADVLPYCASHKIGVVAYSPLASGLLTGKYTEEKIRDLPDEDWRKSMGENFLAPKLQKNLAIVKKIKDLAQREGRTVAQIAIAWVLRRREVTSAIVGARNAAQIAETAPAGDWELNQELIDELESIFSLA